MSIDPAVAAPTPASPSPDEFNWGAFSRYALIAAVSGFALLIAAGVGNLSAADSEHVEFAQKRFVLAYLSGFIYWLSLPIGAMALLMIAYLTKTSWGLLLRRPFEAAIQTWPLFVALFAVVVVLVCTGIASPYWWTSPEKTPIPPEEISSPSDAKAGDKRDQTVRNGEYMIRRTVLREREDREKGIYNFLSKPSFAVVSAVIWAIWIGMILFLLKWGRQASDETSTAKVDAALEKLKNFSGPGIITYAISITAAATLWVMSLEPSWSSTMFPVIFAVNQFLTCFAFCLSVFLFLAGRPPFKDLMRPKFQLDMGTLMLVFTLFWSYTSFSQFMLVWIGNLPEEIPYYLKRSQPSYGAWWCVSAGLIALHFALPFLLLLFRDIKLHPVRLRRVAMYLCVICAIDVVWWIEPSVPSSSNFPYFLMDIGGIVGIGGLFAFSWIRFLKQRPLFPASQAFLLPEGHHVGHH